MSDTNEAMKIWNALKPMVNRQIEEKTKSCVRAKKMTVTTAPNGSVIGVAEPYGEEILIPYLSTLSGASVDDAVWVWYYFNNASTMIAMTMGNGQMYNPAPDTPDDPDTPTPGTIVVSLSDDSVTSSWTNAGGVITSGPTATQKTLSFVVSGVPAGATVSSVTFSATFGSPYTGIDTLTVNGTSVSYGAQSVSLTPTQNGNGTYTVSISFKANGDASLSDGDHSSSLTITSPTVIVTYTA